MFLYGYGVPHYSNWWGSPIKDIIPPYMPAIGSGEGYDSKGIRIPSNVRKILNTPIGPCHKSLVMFVGGAGDELCKPVLHKLYPKYYTENCSHQDIGYAVWSSTGLTSIIKAWHEAKRKICLVGHSWGGDSVHKTAAELEQDGINIDMLCTVDPVSLRGKSGRLPKPSNVKTWLNVALDYTKAKRSIDNTVAKIGGYWGYCKHADENFILCNAMDRQDITHGMAGPMFYASLDNYVRNFDKT